MEQLVNCPLSLDSVELFTTDHRSVVLHVKKRWTPHTFAFHTENSKVSFILNSKRCGGCGRMISGFVRARGYDYETTQIMKYWTCNVAKGKFEFGWPILSFWLRLSLWVGGDVCVCVPQGTMWVCGSSGPKNNRFVHDVLQESLTWKRNVPTTFWATHRPGWLIGHTTLLTY